MDLHYYENINNKDNLLIAIGDSWTAGFGVYTDEQIEQWTNNGGHLTLSQSYLQQESMFGSYPNQLASLLNYDLINLGIAGCSNSASAKRLLNHFDNNYKNKYKKVIVIWLLTDPNRISFYSDNCIKSWSHDQAPISKAYFKDVWKNNNDGFLETAFYLKAIYNFCQANDYLFFYGTGFTVIHDLNSLVNIDQCNLNNMLIIDNFQRMLWENDTNKDLYSPICLHPNKKGYKLIAEKIFSVIKGQI